MQNWKKMLAALPKGLSYSEAARRLEMPYQRVRLAIKRHRYRVSDGRHFSQKAKRKLDPAAVDWSLSNVAIARQFGASKERVRVLRKQLGYKFVESRGRKLVVRNGTDRQRTRRSVKSRP